MEQPSSKIYYGFSIVPKSMRVGKRDLKFNTKLDVDHSSTYKIEGYCQSAHGRLTPYARVSNFYFENGPDGEGLYFKDSKYVMLPGVKLQPTLFLPIKKGIMPF